MPRSCWILWLLVASGATFGSPAPRLQENPVDARLPAGHPLASDRTGVRWEASFDLARERALAEHRLLFVLPDERRWVQDSNSIGLEGFRANVLADDRVSALLNRRFVCFYLDRTPGEIAYDETAARCVIQAAPIFAQEEQVFSGGLPLLFLEPSGRRVEEVRSGTTAEQFFTSLLRILEKQAKYARPSAEEKALDDPLQVARLAIELGDYDTAKKKLRKLKGADSFLELARIARYESDAKEHQRWLARLSGVETTPVAIEVARGALASKDSAAMLAALETIGGDDLHAPEVLYLRAIAQVIAGNEEEALSTLQSVVKAQGEGPYTYRADLAYCNLKESRLEPSSTRTQTFDANRPSASLIGRFYMGAVNYDFWALGRSR